MKSRALVILATIVLLAILVACAPSAAPTTAPTQPTAVPSQPTAAPAKATAVPPTAAPAASGAKKWKIGFLAGTTDPFYSTMQRGALQAANDLGVDLIVQIPKAWNATEQTPMLDAMVARGDLNFLFLAPVDKDAMIPPLKKANDAGLPILTVDTFVGDGDYANGPVKFPLSFIASDNKQGGVIACNALADSIGKKGKVYIQSVRRGTSSTDAREDGCKEALKAYPDITLVAVDYNNDDASTAQAQVTAMLQKTPDLAGIFGTNVFSAQGSGTVVKNQGLSGKVKVVAFDATADAISMLRAGTADLVIAQKPSDMGYLAVEMAAAYLNNVTSIPPSIPTGYAVITRDNMDKPEISRFFYK